MIMVENELEMLRIGTVLGQLGQPPLVIYLIGELGAGKTTFSRGFLRGKGFEGKVKSPTYTIVEPYHLEQCDVYHFDFYRVSDSEELELIGIRDYFNSHTLCLIEWPENGTGRIPEPDIICTLTIFDQQRSLELQGTSAVGKTVLQAFFAKLN